MRVIALLPLALALTAAPARADDNFEFWIGPKVSSELDKNTEVELETAQRLRDGENLYFYRLWVNQAVSDDVTLSAAIERRTQSGRDETRFLQQVTAKRGILRGRMRLVQRLRDGPGQTGWRLQVRGGVRLPLDDQKRWQGFADVDNFITLRATRAGGETGLTAFRTQVGIARKVNDALSLSLAYVRQNDIVRGGADEVVHAPVIGIDLAF